MATTVSRSSNRRIAVISGGTAQEQQARAKDVAREQIIERERRTGRGSSAPLLSSERALEYATPEQLAEFERTGVRLVSDKGEVVTYDVNAKQALENQKIYAQQQGQRFEAVASSATGGVIFRDTQKGGQYIGTPTGTEGEFALKARSPFLAEYRQTPAMPFQNPAIPASQKDGRASYIFTRLAQEKPQNVFESAGRFVGDTGRAISRTVETGSFKRSAFERSPAFVLASQASRDVRYSQASRQPFSFENVVTGFGVARPLYDFSQAQQIRAGEGRATTPQLITAMPGSKQLKAYTDQTRSIIGIKPRTESRFEREYQEEASAFATEYRFINPQASDREVSKAFDRYYRQQLSAEATTEAGLLGLGVGTEVVGRVGISAYRGVRAAAPLVAKAEARVLGALSKTPVVGRYVRPASRPIVGSAVRVSRAELTGAVAGSTAFAGAIEGGATYYVQSGTQGQRTTTADALKSVGLGAISAGTISTTQTRLATSSSRFARGRGERLFTGAVNVLDPQEPLSDALADLTVRSTTPRTSRIRTILSEPTLTQTRSRYPTYTFTSVRPTSRVQTTTSTEAFVSSRSSISPRSQTQTRTELQSYVGVSTRPSTSISPRTQVTARVPTTVSTRTSVRPSVQVSPKVMTPEFPFLLPPRIGGRGRRGGVLGVTTRQPARFATSLTGSVFRFGGGAGSAQAITGVGSRR